MEDDVLFLEIEAGFKDIEARSFRGSVSLEMKDHWAGDSETGFGRDISMNLTNEQALALGQFLVRHASVKA